MTINSPRCSRSKLPALERHRSLWEGCQGCILHESASQKVFYRGDIPCDVLFVGTAPGPTDDALGVPIRGETADTFNEVVDRSIALSPRKLSYAITNAVLCKPPIIENTIETPRPPEKEELSACSPRLSQFLALGTPKLIVNLGKIADKATLAAFTIDDVYYRTITIYDTTYMMKSDDRRREIEKAILQLSQAYQNVFGKKA